MENAIKRKGASEYKSDDSLNRTVSDLQDQLRKSQEETDSVRKTLIDVRKELVKVEQDLQQEKKVCNCYIMYCMIIW
jgi:hypothetical protein